MLTAALRDLAWRRKRFVITVIGTALVFAITLVLTGLSNGFTQENYATERQLNVDAWIVPNSASGPFLGSVPMLDGVAARVARLPGVVTAVPFAFARKSIGDPPKDVNVFGAPSAAPGSPAASQGRAVARDGEVVVSTNLHYRIGDRLPLGGRSFVVVGRIRHSTALGGVPNVFMTLADAQRIAFSGQPIAMAVATRGVPRDVPAGMRLLNRAAARADLRRPLLQAQLAVTVIALLLWLIAGLIVGSVIYLSALERVRDFAVFKAVGVRTREILAGLAVQGVVVSLAAAGVGAAVAIVLAPRFPMLVSIPSSALVALPFIAVAIGVVASVFGVRRVLATQPALAFGGP